MHAFGMSERYLVLAEYPLRVNPLKLAFSGERLHQELPLAARAGHPLPRVRPRDRRRLRGTYETDAFFAFHHVNAFERGDELVVDLVRLRRTRRSSTRSTWTSTGRWREPALERAAPLHDRPRLRRACAASRWPRARSSCRGSTTGAATRSDYRFAYFSGRAPSRDWLDRLVKVDVEPGRGGLLERGRLLSRARRSSCARPGDEAEDGGRAALGACSTRARGRSFLLVLDARTLGELARAEAPHHIPFGFHGQYLP